MKYTKYLTIFITMLVMLSFTTKSARATELNWAHIKTNMAYAAVDWLYVTSGEEGPRGLDYCLENGVYVEYANGIGAAYQKPYPQNVEVVSISPPFLGNKEENGYISICYPDAEPGQPRYIILEMGIALADCHAWICSTYFRYKILEKEGPSIQVQQELANIEQLDISVFP